MSIDVAAVEDASPRLIKRSAYKIALRRARMRNLVSGKLAESRKCALVLGDDDMLESFVDLATDSIDVSGAVVGAFPDGIIKLVEFLLDHIDEIMKIIQIIIDLFTKST